MKRVNWWKLSTIALGAAMIMVLANDKQEKIKAPIPPAAAEMLNRLFPDYHFADSYYATQDGEKLVYVRLLGKKPEDNVLAKITLIGEVIDLDEDMEKNEIPAVILDSFRKAFPKAEILHLEKGIKLETSYRLDINQDGHMQEVKITRLGKIFEVVSKR